MGEGIGEAEGDEVAGAFLLPVRETVAGFGGGCLLVEEADGLPRGHWSRMEGARIGSR